MPPVTVVRAPGVGKIVAVAVGDAVAAGQEVAVIESMKVEIPIAADRAGTVREVRVTTDQTVHAGDPILILDD
jgi:biotin carboxyl carrier protein